MPSQSVNAIQMYYEHHPCADTRHAPLLMLSGMASDSASWQPVIASLAHHFELLIPDNRCTGRTLPNPVATSRSLMVADLIALLDTLHIEHVNVLGHSMGGMLGWALAEQAPERVTHLISASAQSHVIPARVALFKSLGKLRTDQNEADWFELLYQFLFSPSFFEHSAAVKQAVLGSMAYPHKQCLASFNTQADALHSFLAPVNTAAITCPVSLVTGANDLLMTPALLQQFCASHDYPFAIIADAAHALHWEQSEAFAEFVVRALTGSNS